LLLIVIDKGLSKVSDPAGRLVSLAKEKFALASAADPLNMEAARALAQVLQMIGHYGRRGGSFSHDSKAVLFKDRLLSNISALGPQRGSANNNAVASGHSGAGSNTLPSSYRSRSQTVDGTSRASAPPNMLLRTSGIASSSGTSSASSSSSMSILASVAASSIMEEDEPLSAGSLASPRLSPGSLSSLAASGRQASGNSGIDDSSEPFSPSSPTNHPNDVITRARGSSADSLAVPSPSHQQQTHVHVGISPALIAATSPRAQSTALISSRSPANRLRRPGVLTLPSSHHQNASTKSNTVGGSGGGVPTAVAVEATAIAVAFSPPHAPQSPGPTYDMASLSLSPPAISSHSPSGRGAITVQQHQQYHIRSTPPHHQRHGSSMPTSSHSSSSSHHQNKSTTTPSSTIRHGRSQSAEVHSQSLTSGNNNNDGSGASRGSLILRIPVLSSHSPSTSGTTTPSGGATPVAKRSPRTSAIGASLTPVTTSRTNSVDPSTPPSAPTSSSISSQSSGSFLPRVIGNDGRRSPTFSSTQLSPLPPSSEPSLSPGSGGRPQSLSRPSSAHSTSGSSPSSLSSSLPQIVVSTPPTSSSSSVPLSSSSSTTTASSSSSTPTAATTIGTPTTSGVPARRKSVWI
jgi:hypothetical protein